MKNILICTMILLTWLPLGSFAQKTAWKKIRPVESTLTDIERVFGKAPRADYSLRYEIDEGIYYFKLSDGGCVTKWKTENNEKLGGLPPLEDGTPLKDWDLPEWTLWEVYFSPNEWISVASMGINLNRLKKVMDSLDTDIPNYVDEKNGISYEVQYDYKRIRGRDRKIAMVTGITLFPAARYSNRLCK